jgi:hypothetical protein
MSVMVKRILRKYGYAPDKQEKATMPVLQQAELLCKDSGRPRKRLICSAKSHLK